MAIPFFQLESSTAALVEAFHGRMFATYSIAPSEIKVVKGDLLSETRVEVRLFRDQVRLDFRADRVTVNLSNALRNDIPVMRSIVCAAVESFFECLGAPAMVRREYLRMTTYIEFVDGAAGRGRFFKSVCDQSVFARADFGPSASVRPNLRFEIVDAAGWIGNVELAPEWPRTDGGESRAFLAVSANFQKPFQASLSEVSKHIETLSATFESLVDRSLALVELESLKEGAA